MENQPDRSIQEVFDLLKRAIEVGNYADFRQRFASEEQWKVEGPALRREAYMAWYIAKRTIGENRPKFEAAILGNPQNYAEKDVHTFRAALEVIDKEIEQEMELVLTQEIDMDKLDIDEPEDITEEDIDEDEQYVRESTKTWDGDDYIGDEEEFEDEDDSEDE